MAQCKIPIEYDERVVTIDRLSGVPISNVVHAGSGRRSKLACGIWLDRRGAKFANVKYVDKSSRITCKSCLKVIESMAEKVDDGRRYALKHTKTGLWLEDDSKERRWTSQLTKAKLYKTKEGATKAGTIRLYFGESKERISHKEWVELTNQKPVDPDILSSYMAFDYDNFRIVLVKVQVEELTPLVF